MIQTFNASCVVSAVVARVPSEMYFFAQNGAPRQIFCHARQGGVLTVSSQGTLLLQNRAFSLPQVGERIILVRESNDPTTREYTKAGQWVREENWLAAQSLLASQVKYRAIAYSHRNNGHFQSNSKAEVELACASLAQIANKFHRGVDRDTLAEHYSTKLGTTVLSYTTRWERQEANGSWTKCADPRPMIAQN